MAESGGSARDGRREEGSEEGRKDTDFHFPDREGRKIVPFTKIPENGKRQPVI